MENSANRDDVLAVEEKSGDNHHTTIETNTNILDRDKMSKRQFHMLWAGILPTILSILATALVPFYTKVSDVFGRAESLTYALCSYIIGLIVEGTAQSFLHLAIGQIFYGMGITGIQTLSQVLIADTTSLADRGIMFSIWDLGSAVHIWVAQVLIDPLTVPKEGERADKWRIGYLVMGITAIFGAICLMAPLWHIQIKSMRRGVEKQQRKTIRWLLHEFDAVGAVLITLGLSLTLLPLVLAKSYEGNWSNPKIIGMIISGIIFFALLVFWEVKYTDKPIMSMKIWTNRTAIGGLLIVFLLKIMGNVNWQYLTVYFVVSRDISFGDSFMLVRGFQMAWLVFQLLAGFLMKRYNTIRPFAWIGITLYVVGVGLMIPARAPDASVALVVISQTIAGAGGGMAHMAAQVIVTGVVHRNDLATVVGATQILYLPTRLKVHITGDYDETLAMNSPLKYIPNLDPIIKGQLIEAYGDAQKLMSIICCCIAILAFMCAGLFVNIDLRQDQITQDRIALGEDISDSTLAIKEKEDLKEEVK
ncbi:hypothetical protein BGZ76_010131 [Entomortierella beljakovae]|nr:hypothetical protein BGZ76_010131 [Entomortierella beljakovae]